MNHTPLFFLLWAKTKANSGEIHRLIYHMIDVSEVCRALWEKDLPESSQRFFSNILGTNDQEIQNLLAFWVGLHDLGKASPTFQRKYSPIVPELEANGLVFPAVHMGRGAYHSTISAWRLESLFHSEGRYPKRWARQIARALGGHHGAWPTALELEPSNLTPYDKGDELWQSLQKELYLQLQNIIHPPNFAPPDLDQYQTNAFLTLLSGLTSVSDWIGSMESYFGYQSEAQDLSEYRRYAEGQAKRALEDLSWGIWRADGKQAEFEMTFGFSPNDLQAKVIETIKPSNQPALVILEAPTGVGKTEAALSLADAWLQAMRGRGLYVAMPTMATSNQMHQRVHKFLRQRFPDSPIQALLLHSQAQWTDHPEAETQQIGENGEEESTAAMTWFLPRKRSLLAPFGVGTVDQALMSILQTRHFFVRLFGLGQKVIIFDEVHAYDTYMSMLFQQLLAWLRCIGTSVIMLSATLPETVRQELTSAWLGEKRLELPVCEYPRLTTVCPSGIETVPLPPPPRRVLELEWMGSDLQQLTHHLAELIADGGCAAVICNRVKRAQDVYRAIKQAQILPPEELILFHARFPFAWRDDIEKNVLQRFKKGGQRPKKSVVIATQVIEQSLDLDFDVIFTDLAPIDLILQRAGRLHRHKENDPCRPERLRKPRLILGLENHVNGIPNFGDDEWVYDRAVLLRTWLALRERSEIRLPEETAGLIESVYAPAANLEGLEPKLAQAIRAAEEKTRKEKSEEIWEAKKRMITDPGDEDLLNDANQGLEEDNPEVHQAFRALTRLAEPGVEVVCLHQTAKGLALEPDGSGAPLDLTRPPNRQEIQELHRRIVKVQHRKVVDHFLSIAPPHSWKKIASLKHCYLAIFDEQGKCPLEGTPWTLFLHRETGLEIQKEEP